MTMANERVFLLDGDNTLLDIERVDKLIKLDFSTLLGVTKLSGRNH